MLFYFLNCYLQSFQLIASNDLSGTEHVLKYNLRQVNLNQVFLRTIVFTTIATAGINFIKRCFVIKNPVHKN